MSERVLMIDDDAALAGMVAEYLGARGLAVTVAGTLGDGAGYGLALVQRIARLHGGDARCLPREGGGACFEVNVPARPSAS